MSKSGLKAIMVMDYRQLDAAERMLGHIENGIELAQTRAVNRAAVKGATEWSRAVAGDYTVGTKAARMHMAVHRADRLNSSAEVVARPHRFELVDFAHKPRSTIHDLQRLPVGGLSVNVKRSTGYLKVPGAFKVMGTGSGKHHIVWRKREGGKPVGRYPLHILYGPTLSEMALTVLPGIQARLGRYLRQRFNHEVRHIIRRHAEKGRA